MTINALTYLVIEKQRSQSARVVKHSKNRPKLTPGQVAVKIRLKFDESVFSPELPEFELKISGNDVIKTAAAIEVEAIESDEPEAEGETK